MLIFFQKRQTQIWCACINRILIASFKLLYIFTILNDVLNLKPLKFRNTKIIRTGCIEFQFEVQISIYFDCIVSFEPKEQKRDRIGPRESTSSQK